MVAEGSAPVWQYVDELYVKAALSIGLTVTTRVPVAVQPDNV